MGRHEKADIEKENLYAAVVREDGDVEWQSRIRRQDEKIQTPKAYDKK